MKKFLIYLSFLIIPFMSLGQSRVLVNGNKRAVVAGLTSKVNLTSTGHASTTPGWVDYLYTNVGSSISIGNSWTFSIASVAGIGPLFTSTTYANPDFPDDVLQTLLYNNPGASYTCTIGGLNNAKTYSIKCASAYSSAPGDGKTTFTANGVSAIATLNPSTFISTVTLTGVVPSSGVITLTVAGNTSGYAIGNGFIIKDF